MGIDIFYFSFSASMCFRVLEVINMERIEMQPHFWAARKKIYILISKCFFLWKLKNLSWH